MTETHMTGAPAATSTYNVIAVAFDPDINAYAALTALKELDSQDRIRLESAAVVVRDEDGKLAVKDSVGSVDGTQTAVGGLLGLLVGILGGPLGMLLGGSYGLMVGSLFDLGEVDQNESVLSQFATSLKPGRAGLLAELVEERPEVVDTAMQGLGGTVLRRPVDDVEAEIAAAEKAQREAERQADKELFQARREHSKEQAHTKVEALKAKLSHRETTST